MKRHTISPSNRASRRDERSMKDFMRFLVSTSRATGSFAKSALPSSSTNPPCRSACTGPGIVPHCLSAPTLVQALHRRLDVGRRSTSRISLMGGGYSPFTHRPLVSRPSLAVVRRSQHGRRHLSRIPRRQVRCTSVQPSRGEASVTKARVLNLCRGCSGSRVTLAGFAHRLGF